jgi:alpha-tubulin suppressor-like RCC1 family protein
MPCLGLLLAGCSDSEEKVAPLRGVAEVSSGPDHACALLVDGAVVCWGNNYSGQLGDGTTRDRHAPVKVEGVSGAIAVSANGDSSCALLADGSVVCWGVDYVETGLPGGPGLPPHQIHGLVEVSSISVGDNYHTCAAHTEGGVSCWGNNRFGQLGDGTEVDSVTPVSVLELANAAGVAANSFTTCAVLRDGGVSCWGSGLDGVVGDSVGIFSSPTPVAEIADATQVALGDFHGCALDQTGTVSCWGRNTELELGNAAAETESRTPVAVEGLSEVTHISAGFDRSCAVREDGSVWCWGANVDGLGMGEGEGTLASPMRGIDSAISVSVGWSSTCAVLANHTVRCWGYNGYGSLGDGTTDDSFEPVTVVGR